MFLSTSGYACTVDLVLRGNAACMVQAAGTPLDGGVEAAVAELAEEAGQLRVGAVLWGNALCVLPEHCSVCAQAPTTFTEAFTSCYCGPYLAMPREEPSTLLFEPLWLIQ